MSKLKVGKLKEGWYWVAASSDHPWECCQYETGLGWWIEEFSDNKPDNWFPVIGSRIPTPDESSEWLQNLRSSISGECYMGEEWELATIDAILSTTGSKYEN